MYLHRQRSERLAQLMGFLDGFMDFGPAAESIKELNIEVLDHELARGLY